MLAGHRPCVRHDVGHVRQHSGERLGRAPASTPARFAGCASAASARIRASARMTSRRADRDRRCRDADGAAGAWLPTRVGLVGARRACPDPAALSRWSFLPIARRSVPGSPGDPVEFTIDHGWPFFAISPDGRHVAFASAPDLQSRSMLWIRSFDTIELRILPGTEGARFPFWSPDGQAIGFFAAGQVKIVQLKGGAPISLCRGIGQGTWNQEDVIVFGGAPGWVGGSALRRVAARGGTPVAITSLTGDEYAHGFARFLPDGQHFLLAQRPDSNELRVGSLTSSESILARPIRIACYAAATCSSSAREPVAQLFDAGANQLKGSSSHCRESRSRPEPRPVLCFATAASRI